MNQHNPRKRSEHSGALAGLSTANAALAGRAFSQSLCVALVGYIPKASHQRLFPYLVTSSS